MARVSQEHLDARRRQILDGAARCFARNGFHATSMQDVLKEVDLSAGAVYRYFSGKDELIAATVTEVLDSVQAMYERAALESPPPAPDVLIARTLTHMTQERSAVLDTGEWAFPRLMIQVWTETLRNDELSALLRERFTKVRAAWVKVVVRYQEAGMMPDDVDPDAVARTLMATAQGFGAQYALFGPFPPEVLRAGVRGLLGMRETAEGAGNQSVKSG
ncbi:TetR/AcrR family transcriptional regulator [Streptomyces sp. TRM S81-3]|uniref:TetR/AcrR family transcriptional regulator n=1 Tax=Streptomyces griseicoloratus TaxID=2752516 RepID=A0A926QR12_9ACTN|nr:TetR/AcrR family transcriptional regulator [Streptomyces griseicoloratus]MBD0421404.1 TetR/AcrR family transcriptional regulator [Streptomyces griseicoloratus]